MTTSYKGKSYIVNGWQWFRQDADQWDTGAGWSIRFLDRAWWLVGNGAEVFLTDSGVRRAMFYATSDHAALLREPRDD